MKGSLIKICRTNNQAKGYICAVASALIYGCMPLMTVGIYDFGVSTSTLLFLRAILAVPVFAALALIKRDSLRIGLKDTARVALLALLEAGLTSRFLYMSYNYVDTNIATAIHFSYPVLVLLGELAVFHRRLKIKTAVCAVLCAGGVALFCGSGGGASLAGIALAAASALAFAAFIIYLDKTEILERVSFSVYFFYYNFFAAVIGLAVALAAGETASSLLAFTPGLWLRVALFAILVGVVGETVFQVGVQCIGGVRVSFISTLEPLTSIVLGAALLGESLTLLTVLGAVLIIAAVLITIMRKEQA